MKSDVSNVSIKGQENLSDKAYKIIKDKIVKGELKQGDALSINYISKVLNISRTPVTNACQRLENDRFLTIIPKQGIIINTVSITDAREIYELRMSLETYFADRAFDAFTDEDIAYLKESYERQVIAVENKDAEGFMKEDMLFHSHMLKKSNNEEVMLVLKNIFDRAYLLGIESCKTPFRLEKNIIEHRKILDMLKKKNRSEFVKSIESNIENGLACLINKI